MLPDALALARQLHNERLKATLPLDGVDRGDVRMIQRGERLGFALEPCQPVGIGGECLGEDLDGDLAAQRGVGGAPHLSHAAFTDRCSDFVDAETRADGQGQG